MSDYRRWLVPGGTFFFTLVTYDRSPFFRDPENVARLRAALSAVKQEQPFEVAAAIVLPDHMHFMWTLPRSDLAYPRRIGRL